MTEMEKLIVNGEDFFPASAQVPERAGAPHHFGKGIGKSAPLSSCSVLVFSALAVPKLHRGVRVVPLVCAAGRVSVGAAAPCASASRTRERQPRVVFQYEHLGEDDYVVTQKIAQVSSLLNSVSLS